MNEIINLSDKNILSNIDWNMNKLFRTICYALIKIKPYFNYTEFLNTKFTFILMTLILKVLKLPKVLQNSAKTLIDFAKKIHKNGLCTVPIGLFEKR